MRAAVLVLSLALAACQEPAAPQKVEPAPAAPPPQAPAEPVQPALLGDIDGRGNEPFWFVEVRGQTLKLERPDHDAVVTPARRLVEGPRTVWVGEAFTVSAAPQAGCSDGMSELSYPLEVEVAVGVEILRGCGAAAGQLPTGER